MSTHSEDDDAALFRAAVGVVTPLTKQNYTSHQPVARQAFFNQTSPLVSISDSLSDFYNELPPDEYLSNGLSRMTLRKLRRNFWPIQDSLDLHGLQSDAARRLLQQFLHQAGEQQLRCVLVIHGKGLNSASGEAVLKIRARHWLTQHPRVLAYCDAAPQLGGTGAVLILLRISP